MSIRKLLRTIVAVTLISVLFVTPVSAHGHHHRQTTAAASTTTTAATVTDTSCPVCTVEGCTETGRHTHDGYDYCGYDHADGYCDGTCAAVGTTTTYCGRGGGHHGCHR